MSTQHGLSLVQALALIQEYVQCLEGYDALDPRDVESLCGVSSEELFRFNAGIVLQAVIDALGRDPGALGISLGQPPIYEPIAVIPAPTSSQKSFDNADSTLPRADSLASSDSHWASAMAPAGVRESSRKEVPDSVDVFMPVIKPSAWSRAIRWISTPASLLEAIGPSPNFRSAWAKLFKYSMFQALLYVIAGAILAQIIIWASGAAQ